MSDNAFDSTRDERLGRLLRESLDAPDHAAFAARLRARIAGPRLTAWDVLGAWWRPELAAAAALIVAALLAASWQDRAREEHPASLEATRVLDRPAGLTPQTATRDQLVAEVLGSR